MAHSRKRKVPTPRTTRRASSVVPLASAISAILAGVPISSAQDNSAAVLDSVIVTAQKREEDLQKVPLSIQTLNNEQLENLQIANFNDYAKLLPSVSFQTIGPGFARVYMRGVSSGDNGNHSGSLPSVGVYLDEQPVTTIQGPLDIHLYDIARVEVLAGPQGTLYGASSQAGTIRIITNKPEVGQFSAGYDLEGNLVKFGGEGYGVEGFANIPITDSMAIRLVGWARHDAGYIDNAFGTRTYPTSGITIDNRARAKENYNDADTYGARAALKVDLNDNWTITPTVMGQDQKVNGNFATDPLVGDLALTHFYPESSHDRWVQAALTVEGKISNFDLVYAGAYLKRNVDLNQDYSDYSFFYDTAYGSYIVDDANNLINPSQYIQGRDHYKKLSHELRLSSPTEWRARFVMGLFMQRQVHDIEQRYKIDNLADSISVTGWPDTIWLTEQERVDRDYAVFGEGTFDITDRLSTTLGVRFFKAENSLKGFFGFNSGYSSGTGEAACFSPEQFHGAPCVNLDKTVNESGTSPKVNLTYKFNDQALIYATWARGFRPGGVNRRGTFPPYDADYLNSFEIGWKTSWNEDSLRFNGAVFYEDWQDFQFSFLGQNGLTNITNAGGAEITGIEATIDWAVTRQLRVSAGASYLNAELSEFFCKQLGPDGNPLSPTDCVANNPNDAAPAGTQLPITPKFKGNVTGRYLFKLGDFDSHLQGSLVYVGGSRSALLPSDSVFLHDLAASTVLDLSTGIERDKFNFELFITNATDERVELYRYAECATQVCGPQPYTVTNQPRTVGLKFGQKF
jgi:outer membrane receptor protein involved in Fe transport